MNKYKSRYLSNYWWGCKLWNLSGEKFQTCLKLKMYILIDPEIQMMGTCPIYTPQSKQRYFCKNHYYINFVKQTKIWKLPLENNWLSKL